jgi:transposase
MQHGHVQFRTNRAASPTRQNVVSSRTGSAPRLKTQSGTRNRKDFPIQAIRIDRMGRTNMPDEYLIGDKARATIEPLLPKVYAGARRHDHRRIISWIVHVCTAVAAGRTFRRSGPHTTVYNRFNRWSRRRRWHAIFDALVATVPNDTRSIDSTSIKVHDQGSALRRRRKRRRAQAGD